MVMRAGRASKADAITNSPFVRALIRPVRSVIPPSPATTVEAVVSPPQDQDLIPTQPQPRAGSSNGGVGLQNGKGQQQEVEVPMEETQYTEANLPEELQKYWAQRYRLFSLFDEGIQMDKEGWYSVTPESIAQQIAERCRCGTIVDAFCGVGGNAIQFAFTCERVIAIDTSSTRLACARANAKIYEVEDRIEFIQADYLEWAKERAVKKDRQDIEVVFLSPPWGGIDYQTVGTGAPHSNGNEEGGNGEAEPEIKRSKKRRRKSSNVNQGSANTTVYPLSALQPVSGQELFTLSHRLTPHVAMYLPRNVDVIEVAHLGRKMDGTFESVELEEEWMGYKLKAVTAYFGELACNHSK